MTLEEDFLILDTIDRHQPRTQRELANLCELSLGKVNYVVKKLMREGLVEVSSFKNGGGRRGKLYVLTQQGMEAKTQLSTPFLKARMKEFEDFRNRLLENLLRLQGEGIENLLVVGSRSVGSLLEHITRRENLNIRIIGTASNADHFGCFSTDAYDCILIAEDPNEFSKLIQSLEITADKVTYLK